MADDTAALVVALSAQITKFEKDMQQAVGIADKHTKKIEQNFNNLNKSISGALSSIAQNQIRNLGAAGDILASLGTAGTVAAVGIGAAIGAIVSVIGTLQRFVDQADKMKTAAEVIGVSITQIKALGTVGLTVGKDFEETARFFETFIGNLERLRSGQGPLFDALAKIDRALIAQLTSAKNSAEAIDILVAAFKRLDESQRIALARAAGGKGGAALLTGLTEKGGLAGAAFGAPNIDAETKRIADLNTELTIAKQKSEDLLGGMFSEAYLRGQTRANNDLAFMLGLLEKIRDFKDNLLDRFFKGRAGIGTGGFDEAGMIAGLGGIGVPLPTPRPTIPKATPTETPEVQLEFLRRQLAAVGELVTLTEQRTLKEKELTVALKDKFITEEQNKRVTEGIALAQKIAINTARERFGIASEEQIVEGRLASLRQDEIRLELTATEVQRAKVIILREAKDAADRLTVRQSYLPGLTQLAVDIARVDKELDKFGVQSLNTLTDSFADVITGTKKLSDAFRDMVSSILKELAKLLIRQSIIGPLASLLGSFTPTSGFGLSKIGGQAAGTNNFAGGWTWVGEKGPELVNLPKGSQVVPNDVARGGVGGVSVGVTSTIVVQGDASERTLMLIEGALARQKRELPNDIIKTVQQMKSRRAA